MSHSVGLFSADESPSDGLKRAAAKFGLGLYLYQK
jgi:hypothetical protein